MMNQFRASRSSARALWTAVASAAMITIVCGCASRQVVRDVEPPRNPTLRPLEIAEHASSADADRAALARIVGVWRFTGWSADTAGVRTRAAGRAAATIEDEHFVLMDVQASAGQLGVRPGRKAGSLLFASEPGIGVTLTGWGDASPTMGRFVGRALGAGSAFELSEAALSGSRGGLKIVIRFDTDDCWTLEVRDGTIAGSPALAAYTFVRDAH